MQGECRENVCTGYVYGWIDAWMEDRREGKEEKDEAGRVYV